jgi:hypothetical protein
MVSREILEGTISELEEAADSIENKTKVLIEKTPIIHTGIRLPVESWSWGGAEDESLQRDALREYQSWFSLGLQLVSEFLPEKAGEFAFYYNNLQYPEGVLKFIQLRCFTCRGNKEEIKKEFNNSFELQRSILLSIPSVAEIKELSLRKLIASDFIDSELQEADYLFKNGFERCAGVLAGVALERYLKALCEMKKINYEYDATIEPLSQALYVANKIDLTDLKAFQHLGSIRNDCAHPKDVPEDELKGRAKELIERVKKLSL